MKTNVFLSIFIVVLWGICPFRMEAQREVVYPYMNYLNMPSDNPSLYVPMVGYTSGSPNRGNPLREGDTCFKAEAFNYPVMGKPDTRLVYGVAISIYSREDPYAYEIDVSSTIDIELYKVTEGESDVHLIKKMTGYLYPGKRPDIMMRYQLVTGYTSDTHEPIYQFSPIYEFYFDKPVSVTGTFLATATLNTDDLAFGDMHAGGGPLKGYDAWIQKEKQIIYGLTYGSPSHFYYDSAGLPAPDIELQGIVVREAQWTFPILVPEGTTAVPTVEGGEPFEVLLTPNPAAEQATAATEAGIRSIEVVDMAGRTIARHSYHALPRNVTFDVKALPRGIYAVRVDTPQGIATKKLAVE